MLRKEDLVVIEALKQRGVYASKKEAKPALGEPDETTTWPTDIYCGCFCVEIISSASRLSRRQTPLPQPPARHRPCLNLQVGCPPPHPA